MVRHILLWQLKDELTPAEKRAEAEQCKRDLEALVGVVPGLISLHVEINPMDSSNVDMMLDSTMTDATAYDGYKVHPAHVAAANHVRSVVKSRVCMDYEF